MLKGFFKNSANGMFRSATKILPSKIFPTNILGAQTSSPSEFENTIAPSKDAQNSVSSPPNSKTQAASNGGAINLLQNCAKLKAGEKLLIIHEPENLGYYEAELTKHIQQTAENLGIITKTFEVEFSPNVSNLDKTVQQAMMQADKTLFLARLGDQLRFSDIPNGKHAIVCYALSVEMLNSPFGRANYLGFMAIKNLVDEILANAKLIEGSCAKGTNFSGKTSQQPKKITPTAKTEKTAQQERNKSDVTIERFPMSVFAPQLAKNFSGQLALSNFLVGTGSKNYTPYSIEFKETIFAHFKEGRIQGFTGPEPCLTKVKTHYDHVAKLFNIDRDFVHSWHAGLHPGCGFDMPIKQSYERWSGAAFGNPRVLHFHTCGAYAPGEISLNIIDPTIKVDGTLLWEAGKFHIEHIEGSEEILQKYPCIKACFQQPEDYIGL